MIAKLQKLILISGITFTITKGVYVETEYYFNIVDGVKTWQDAKTWCENDWKANDASMLSTDPNGELAKLSNGDDITVD